MQYPVIVRTTDANDYEAEPVGIPELRTVAPTEVDALERVRAGLGKWFTSAKVIQVDVPANQSGNPWLEAFGRSASDPDFDELLQEISNSRTENALQ